MAPLPDQVPVLVVGGGPVGLATALDLGWRGVPCLLVEQGDGSVEQPRMDLVGIRSMEFCRRWGIVDEVRNAGYAQDRPQDIVYVTSVSGYEMGREYRPAMAAEKAPAFSPQKRERCPQNFFDPVLLRAASRQPGVTLRHRHRLVGMVERTHDVLAEIENLADGTLQTVSASYVIGCDGAASKVRELLQIPMHGEAVLTNSTNLLIRCDDMTELSGKPEAYRYVLIDENGLWATLVAIDGRGVWRLQIIGGPDRPLMTLDEVHAAVRKALGRDGGYTLMSVLPWRRKELVASRFRGGRAFLVGDSAHQMSPTGGFGMNTGMGDAVDLCWKIDATLSGWGSDGLLDSYEAERQPIAFRNVREASDNLARMVAVDGHPDMFRPGPAGEQIRHSIGAAASAAMQREWNAIGIHIGYRYDQSPICWPDGTPIPDVEITSYTQMARPGARAPHAWLSPGHSTLDLFGRGYALMSFGGDADHCTGLLVAARSRGVPMRLEHRPDPALRALYGADHALVRPDGHVAWRGDVAPADPMPVIDRLRGIAMRVEQSVMA